LRPSLAAVFLSFALACLSSAPVNAAGAGLFGTRETYSSDLTEFTKWDGVVLRTEQALDGPVGRCTGAKGDPACAAAWWHAFVAELKTLPLKARVDRVNAVLNRVPYVSAVDNWHDPNHWETPVEFLTRGGQCQDYAIAKFMALEESGVPENDLRLVVVHDVVSGADHAVTIVYVDGTALVLDNETSAILPDNAIDRYRPYYSINRLGWWYHQAAPTKVAQLDR
jgi:predicted transglutaminase-like cysteine proteinase